MQCWPPEHLATVTADPPHSWGRRPPYAAGAPRRTHLLPLEMSAALADVVDAPAAFAAGGLGPGKLQLRQMPLLHTTDGHGAAQISGTVSAWTSMRARVRIGTAPAAVDPPPPPV